jgi:hypothetical protein
VPGISFHLSALKYICLSGPSASASLLICESFAPSFSQYN